MLCEREQRYTLSDRDDGSFDSSFGFPELPGAVTYRRNQRRGALLYAVHPHQQRFESCDGALMAESNLTDLVSSRSQTFAKGPERLHCLPGVIRQHRVRLQRAVAEAGGAVTEKENAVHQKRRAPWRVARQPKNLYDVPEMSRRSPSRKPRVTAICRPSDPRRRSTAFTSGSITYTAAPGKASAPVSWSLCP
jgi:hypothetical protein